MMFGVSFAMHFIGFYCNVTAVAAAIGKLYIYNTIIHIAAPPARLGRLDPYAKPNVNATQLYFL